MAGLLEIDARSNLISSDDVTRTAAQVEIPNFSSCLVSVQVFATRVSDLASKGWSLESLLIRNGGTVSVKETIPQPVNVFANAADAISLALVSIALHVDPVFIGVDCTGLAGVDIEWSIHIYGRAITSIGQ